MSFVSDRERNPLLGSDPLPGGIVPKKMTYLNLVIIFGGVLMASLGATSNSFNALQSNIQDSVGLSDSQMSIMAGAGLLGTNFMIPAGIMRDNLGLFKTGMISILLSGGGYLGMAYCTVPGLYVPMLICFFMAGFGGGACFLCALNTAIQISPSGGGWGVAATSAAMSFSISLTVYIINWTTSIFDCDVATDSSCAFLYLKAIGISCLGVQFIGLLFTLFFNRKNYLHLLTLEDDDTEVVKSIKSLGTDLTHISQPGRSITGRQLTTSSLAAYAVHGRSATTLLSGPTDAEGRPTGVRPKYELLNKINNGDDDAATALAVETKSFVDTLQILKHPLFLKLGFGYYLGFASAFFIISQAQQIWQMYGYEDQAKYSLILPVFSYSTIVANVVTSLASDYLNTHKILSHAQYMGVVHLIFAVDFLLIWVFSAFIETKSIAVLFMMGLNGLSFGSVVTCYPTSLGFIYGLNNFSKPFAFLGIGSGLAAFTTPILGNALIKALGPENFAYSYLGMGVLLLVAAILTLTSKTKPYKWR